MVMHPPRDNLVLGASLVATASAAVLVLASVILASGHAAEARAQAARGVHELAGHIDDAVYVADPLLRITGTIHAPELHDAEVAAGG